MNKGLESLLRFLFWFVIFFGLFSLLLSPCGIFILAAIFLVTLVMMPLFITLAMMAAILDE